VGFALISHRGGGEFGPENTLEALEEALERGVTSIETDVHQAGDGTLVIHHDAEVNGLAIRDAGFEQLRAKRPEMPSLEEYLDLARGRCFLNLEIKRADPAALARALSSFEADRLLVSSFSLEILRGLREAAPGLALGLLPDSLIRNSEAADAAAAEGFRVILPFELLATRHLVERAHRHGLKVVAWTVNLAPALDLLLERGADGIITDRYPAMREHLAGRGITAVDSPLG
jgi:glycerophosphoryl diester phosphodiesterase